MFLKLIETCLIHRCTHDSPHRCFVGLGVGRGVGAPTALLAFHQLIVNGLQWLRLGIVVKVTALKRKKVNYIVMHSSHPWLNKPTVVCFIFK